MHKILLCCFLSFSLFLSAGEQLASSFSLHNIFGSNMVLQRDRPIRFSGQGTPRSWLKVQLGGYKKKIRISRSGEWEAIFPALPAGGPYTLMLSGNSRTRNLILDNILIGEVWLCSGQSNMEMPLFSKNPHWRAANAREERNNADYPQIRLFHTMPEKSPFLPRKDIPSGSWQVCTPDTAGNFSALAYFYGRELHRRLKVPVGLISASCGGTPIEVWIPGRIYQDYPGKFKTETQKINQLARLQKKILQEKDKEKLQAEWFRKFYHHVPEATSAAAQWKKFQYKDTAWKKIQMPWNFPEQYDGVVWIRNTFSLPPEFTDTPIELRLGNIGGRDETYLNGKTAGHSPMKPQTGNASLRIYRLEAGIAMRGKNVLAIRLSDFGGRSGLRWKAEDITIRRLDNGRLFTLADNWKMKPEFLIPAGSLPPIPVIPQDEFNRLNNYSHPSTLFNSMIAPWQKLPIRGVIWYQGCANVGQERYYERHQLLINSWRKGWHQPDMPFLLVQLSAFEKHCPDHRLPEDFWKSRSPENNVPWALTREIQSELTRMPGVGMAVSIDRGDHSDIHPRDKQTIAARLAGEAERLAYGKNDHPRSPEYSGMRIEKNKIRIFFKYAGSRLQTSDRKAPGGFAIAGQDGRFVWGQTQIIGDTVLVFSPEIPNPAAVRYGWVKYREDLNLCNEQGLPAIPFRTDKPAYPPLLKP